MTKIKNMQDSFGVKSMSQLTIKVIKGKNNTKSLQTNNLKSAKIWKGRIAAKKDMHVCKELTLPK